MFQGRPRRPYPPPHMHHRRIHPRQQPKRLNILSQFYDAEGKLDIEKMTKTAEDIKQIYSQISPIFSKLVKK
ncbi:YppG family protein [Niallia sp. XMNu-256]|uniref:YppG family protein n=1 Tax=Niallia sp. XMNu-256 TaxID=3082444 RepID=UPI0030CCDE6F